MRDMPEHEGIKQLLAGTNVDFFRSKKIVDILKETEADSKNFFGSYGSKRMKDWAEILKLYQRDNVYLAEAAQLLSQAVHYEIPALKKQSAKAVQLQTDCDKKEKDSERRKAEAKAEFRKACQQLGIEGVKLRKEIIRLLDDLPSTYKTIAEDAAKLKKAKEIYASFVTKNSKVDEDVLPTLGFLMERGNVTTYEWVHGEAPLSVEETALDFGEDDEDKKTADDGFDFGDDDVQLESGGEIDWGNLDSAEDDAEIDWGIGTESEDVNTLDIVVEDGGVAGGVAKDAEALSILDNRHTRTLIIDDLTELLCFLQQRFEELKAAGDGNFSLLMTIDANDNMDEIRKTGESVQSVIDRLTEGKIHHLQLIRTSPKYVERLVDGLKHKLALESKAEAARTSAIERRESAIEEQGRVQKTLERLRAKTKELQKEIEEDVSKRYKNRPVNIMGGIQSV